MTLIEQIKSAAALTPLGEIRFVVWRYELGKSGKRTKVPYIALRAGMRKASTTNPKTWRSFDAACEAYASGDFAGIGFVLTNGPYCAFDLDNCRDPETGEFAPWAREVIDDAGSCTELTPSGRGARIIGTAHRDGAAKDWQLSMPRRWSDGSLQRRRSRSLRTSRPRGGTPRRSNSSCRNIPTGSRENT